MFSVRARVYDIRMVDCTLVTCVKVPALDPDDRLLLDELRERGLTVSVGTWNDPRVDWSASHLCILRSTWDYHLHYGDFIAWIADASSVTRVRNPLQLLSWNAHKSYLSDLERRGVPIVPTAWLQRGEPARLAQLAAARGWRDVVLKPARGAAAHKVALVTADGPSPWHAQTVLDEMLRTDDVLVQPYLGAVVTYGERALVFFGRRHSHAVVKKPFDRDLAISGAPETLAEATVEEIAVATAAVEAVPGTPLYARVDLLRDDDGRPRVSELELIEPALYLAVHDPARRAFADAIERELAIHG